MLCNIKLNFIFLVIIDLNYCFPKELPKINKRINSDSFEKQITQLKKKKTEESTYWFSNILYIILQISFVSTYK